MKILRQIIPWSPLTRILPGSGFRIIILLSFLLPADITSVTSQDLSPVVIASTGGSLGSTEGSLSYTVGESGSVTTLETADVILTQGFQQVFDFQTAVSTPSGVPITCHLFPNPSNGNFTLRVDTAQPVKADIVISDLLGRLVLARQVHFGPDLPTHDFSIPMSPTGILLVEIIAEIQQSEMTASTVLKLQMLH